LGYRKVSRTSMTRSKNVRVSGNLPQAIDVESAAAVDAALRDATQKIMDSVHAGIWKWHCTNGLDHDHQDIGSHVVHSFHSVVRFGALVYNELYRICGRVYGEKNCYKALAQLVEDNLLVRAELGRKVLFGLHPHIPASLSSASLSSGAS
jgi:hypothetical protein